MDFVFSGEVEYANTRRVWQLFVYFHDVCLQILLAVENYRSVLVLQNCRIVS